jgi:hypothetical protein
MSTGAEGSARIDHDGRRVGRRVLPRRPDPDRADRDAVVEVAPALGPVLAYIDRNRTGEGGAQAPLARRVGVDGQLEPVRPIDLLEAVREQLQNRGTRLLGPVEIDENGEAPQRNALFSFWKRPWSLL